jgi:hypothetical protein
VDEVRANGGLVAHDDLDECRTITSERPAEQLCA